jgi:hypothetical protein
MACGFINLQHIKSEANVSDILSKHWGYQACWELIRPIFHFRGDTSNLFYDGFKFTTITDLRNFHDGECYHDVEVFPRWVKITTNDGEFRSNESPRLGVLSTMGRFTTMGSSFHNGEHDGESFHDGEFFP